MSKVSGILLGLVVLVCMVGCGGGSSTQALPTPTPPPQTFPNDTSTAQSAPVKLGTSGGNEADTGTSVCCIGTLGSLWTLGGVPNPVILSNNHVLDRSSKGVAGEVISQPVQTVCTAPTAPAPLAVAHLLMGATLKPTMNETTGPCTQSSSGAPLCGRAPDNVDAAIAQIVPGEVDTSGTILDFGPVGTSTIAAMPPSSTIGTASIGETVGKAGRTTGLTCSSVQSLNLTILIDYEGTCGDSSATPPKPPAFTAYFLNQVTITGGSFSSPGDSGSLIVDTTNARPVALLYGGNSVSTVAHPIQDVISAISKDNAGATFTIVGGGDHAISCAHTATASATQVGTAQSTLTPQERQRVAAVRQARVASLMRDFNLASVEAGASADNPSEGALLLHVSGKSIPAVPPVIDGVRTRLVFDNAAAQIPALTSQQIAHATAVKEAHASEFLGHAGIQGFGVTTSSDNPTESAVAIYVIQGVAHQTIPPMLDGVRTSVFEGTRFKAY